MEPRQGRSTTVSSVEFDRIRSAIDGSVYTDEPTRRLYATDASEYQELPLAVIVPSTERDVGLIMTWAGHHRIALIPRAAGTSLAGQVVGGGVALDMGRHLNRIIRVDPEQSIVTVQPGVVRNRLNQVLEGQGLFFAPETSTANRAMIGGMVGNNSSGANSIVYGSTRDHLIAVRGFLSDGSEATFGPLTKPEFEAKCDGLDSLETRIYREVRSVLGSAENREAIRNNFPKHSVTRRNTGYALDQLIACEVFQSESDQPFNLCRLLAGSEGTLFVGIEYTLNCVTPPPPGGMMCAHFSSVADALQATLLSMRHQPYGCELIDRHILECTRANLEQARNRFFIEGDPGAILVVELRDENRDGMAATFSRLEEEFRQAGLGYAFPVLWGAEGDRVWQLRRAGQGLMANVPGSAKPREVVEDTAVAVEDLPAYIAEFDELLREKYDVSCVYYAHAGAGELHTRPLFDLRSPDGLRLFRAIATDVAALVKKYRGSLSGEHGDGRLRGEFIPFMVGDECYQMMRRLKFAFDPDCILNPGKIIDAPPLETSLRAGPDSPDPSYLTVFNFDREGGVLRAVERCNGVGECRKSHLMGGTMCPSFMATLDEHDSTRGRANLLRQALSAPADQGSAWEDPSLGPAMDLCISCKGCKSECPSSVDMAKLKGEWQQHWQDRYGVPLRSRLIAGFASLPTGGGRLAPLLNALTNAPLIGPALMRTAGFTSRRKLPRLSRMTLRRWYRDNANPAGASYPHGRVNLFCDEFTDSIDTDVGVATIELLNRLGWFVALPAHRSSGRAEFSKGMLRDARALVDHNVKVLDKVVTDDAPLIGVEPSAILGFRDEYPEIASPNLRGQAVRLARRVFTVDEFLAKQSAAGRVLPGSFDDSPRSILVHGHCHQKALGTPGTTLAMLSIPSGHRVTEIPSGCCGMAGSFGYEAEHYDLSMRIGELVLFPAVREAAPSVIVAAAGTSCRSQLRDGLGRESLHPVEILRTALR